MTYVDILVTVISYLQSVRLHSTCSNCSLVMLLQATPTRLGGEVQGRLFTSCKSIISGCTSLRKAVHLLQLKGPALRRVSDGNSALKSGTQVRGLFVIISTSSSTRASMSSLLMVVMSLDVTPRVVNVLLTGIRFGICFNLL